MVNYDEDLDTCVIVGWVISPTYFPLPVIAKKDTIINEEDLLP
jgi:hypothetical protein